MSEIEQDVQAMLDKLWQDLRPEIRADTAAFYYWLADDGTMKCKSMSYDDLYINPPKPHLRQPS